MSVPRLRIWCNQQFPDDARAALEAGISGHELVLARRSKDTNLVAGLSDEDARDSDVAFGQPDPADVVASRRLKWVHLSSAGYTRYDRDDVRAALRERAANLTNSSSVYADPCAQHVLAMMLGVSRRLHMALMSQQGNDWNYRPLRRAARTLSGESVLIVGYGAIGQRLVELLAPFRTRVTAVRRQVRGDEVIPVRALEQVDEVLPDSDHVVDLLPAGANTRQFFNAARFGTFKPGAVFYNVGRGETVDQDALIGALKSERLASAYLDVTSPEPLPADHPLWTAPNCFITPHIAGGHQGEHRRLVEHFIANLRRFERDQPLEDPIM